MVFLLGMGGGTKSGRRDAALWRLVTIAWVVLLSLVLTGSAATASTNDLRIGGMSGSLFAVSEMSPGDTVSQVISVGNAGRGRGASGPVRLATEDVRGRLADELQLTVVRTADASTAYRGSIAALSNPAVVIPDLAAGRTEGLEVSITLPESAENEWEGTSVSFGVVFTLEETGPGAHTAGSSVRVPGVGERASQKGVLAFTGTGVSLPMAAGAAAILLGLLLLTAARRRD